ncbi:hypothetical protein FRC04_008495 [Tulasnella sp. 424]|nr:hypothetical protein FRC04_008495 [Tulasnella sp. 424]
MDIFQIPQLDYSTLMRELESRAFVSSSTGMGRRERKVALLKALQEVVGLINFAEAAKSAETSVKQSYSAEESSRREDSSPSQPEEVGSWNRFIDEAATKLSKICRRMYKADMTDCIEPYAVPSGPGRHIETMRYLASSIYSNPEFLDLLAPALGETSLTAVQNRMRDTNVIPPKWQETLRPHKLSTPMSRFESDYDSVALSEAAQSSFAVAHPFAGVQSIIRNMATRRQEVLNILQARAEIHQTTQAFPFSKDVCRPEQMALNKNELVVCDDTQLLKRYTIGQPKPEESDRSDGWSWEEERINHGFASELEGLLIDSSGKIWVSGDSRIKAFGSGWKSGEIDQQETGDQSRLKWTLNSTGYTHAFGVTEEAVFRANRGGTVAFWKQEKLVEHDPVWMSDEDSSTEPYGGRIKTSKRRTNGSGVEISLGEIPHGTIVVPNLSGTFGLLESVPGTSRFLCTEGIPEKMDIQLPKNLSVQALDLASPESSAITVGVGFGTAVSVLATHQDMPHCFAAAGDDPCVRIFDMRSSVLPEILLDGHSGDVLSCAIASHGTDFPIIFTGGKDELVKAWDIRHTKKCMYELATGTTHPKALGWHDESQSLFMLGRNVHGEAGYDWDEDYWPQRAERNSDYFGVPWCSSTHLIVEYRFKTDPNSRFAPQSHWDSGMDSGDEDLGSLADEEDLGSVEE